MTETYASSKAFRKFNSYSLVAKIEQLLTQELFDDAVKAVDDAIKEFEKDLRKEIMQDIHQLFDIVK